MVAFPRNPREFRVCDKFYFDHFGRATVNLDLPSSPATQAEKNVNVMHNNRGGKSRALGQRAET